MKSVGFFRWVITALMFLIAIVLAYMLWNHYMYSPWTRDGRIRADITKVAPDVSGIVTDVRVKDNQFVHKGDVLMVIDKDRYILALEDARTNLRQVQANYRESASAIKTAQATVAAKRSTYQMYAAQAERRGMLSSTAISKEALANAISTAQTAKSELTEAQATLGQQQDVLASAQVAIQRAEISVKQAQLDLDRTDVKAPTDGYVTNVTVRNGNYANAGKQQMALIDSNSFYIYGYFEETKLPHLHIGDHAEIRLMAGNADLNGTVTGIARGIGETENANSDNQLLNVDPTFDWVRLAQRVPVRIAIDTEHMPKDTILVSGMTATVILHPGSYDD